MDYCPFSNVCLAYGCHFWLMGCCFGVYVPLTLAFRSLFSVYGLCFWVFGCGFGFLAVGFGSWAVVFGLWAVGLLVISL